MNQTVGAGRKARGLFHTQAVFGTSFTILTSGVFLSGLALLMGANDLLVGYINIIANICGISILFFASLMERVKSFKRAAVWLTAASRVATILIVLIPLVIPQSAQIAVFVPLLIAAFTLQSQTTVVLNNWLAGVTRGGKSGRNIALRQTFVMAVSVVLSLTGGMLLDSFGGKYLGFAVLFAAAFGMSVFEVVTLLFVPDVARERPGGERRARFFDTFRLPAKHRPFLRFVLYIFTFYFFLTFADSFTVLYMMRYLELPYTAVTGLQLIMSLPQLLLLGLWGKLSDKKGHRFTLIASVTFFIGEMGFLALTGPTNLYACIPVAFSFAAIANAGFSVSVFNRRYELMPEGGRVLFDNFFTAAVGLAVILGPLAGQGVKLLLENTGAFASLQFGALRGLYALSALALLVLQVAAVIVTRRRKGKHCAECGACPTQIK